MLGAVTLDQLRMLIAIEETGSFSAAGRKLRRVQSAVSHAIQSLEEAQGLVLFDRSGRAPKFTEAGRALVAQARQVIMQAELFERTSSAIAAGLEPELTIAVDTIIPIEPVMRSLAGLQLEFPDLALTAYTEAAWGGERRARDGSAMIALCLLDPTSAQDLQAYPVMSMTLVPVAGSQHPLAQEDRPISREILSQHVQLVLTNPHDPSGPSHSVVSPRVWRFVDLSRRLEFLLAGFGWGTMPLHLIERHLADGRLKRLAIDDSGILPGPVPLYVAHTRARPLGKGARWLLDNLREQSWP